MPRLVIWNLFCYFFPFCFSLMNQKKERNIKRVQQQRELASVGLGTARYNNKTMSTFLFSPSLSLSLAHSCSFQRSFSSFSASLSPFRLLSDSLAAFARRRFPSLSSFGASTFAWFFGCFPLFRVCVSVDFLLLLFFSLFSLRILLM